MKRFFALLVGVLFLSTGAFAQATDGNLIEIGAGGTSANDGTIEALIQVKGNLIHQYSKNGYFIIVRIKADGSISGKDFSYVDMEMHALGVGGQWEDDLGVFSGFVEGSLLNINYQRNLALDMDHMMTLNLVGLRIGASVQITDNIKIMAEASMDLASVALSSKRSSDLMSMTKAGLNDGEHFKAELAVILAKKIKIAVGVSSQNISANGYEYKTGTQTCNEVSEGYWSTDYYGNDQWVSTGSHTECTDDTATNYQESWKSRSTYVMVMAQLTKHLSIFAKANYSVFEMTDETLVMANSQAQGWRFMFGVVYQIGGNKDDIYKGKM
ncbi:MAG: hypothetical protein ACOYL6_18695 [Bacteriovoracaceae bacterium]